MQNEKPEPMAIIVRNDDMAKAVQLHMQTNFQSDDYYNLDCSRDGHRLMFKSAYLPEKVIRNELSIVAREYRILYSTDIAVEYIDNHEQDYILFNL